MGRWNRCSSALRIIASAITTAKYDTALPKNTHSTPTYLIRSPPSAGPVMRAEFSTALLSATAFGSFSRPTISSTNAWRAGSSTTVTRPKRKAIPNSIHTCTTPVNTTTHNTTASRAASDCVTSITRRRSKWSAIAPPQRPKNSTGPKRNANVAPTAAPLPVSWSANHASAMACIHPPTWEIRSPVK